MTHRPGAAAREHLDLALRRGQPGSASASFEEMLAPASTGRAGPRARRLVAKFPGPFLYYPSRRQPPPALAAFIAFVAEWRKQERRKEQGSSTV